MKTESETGEVPSPHPVDFQKTDKRTDCFAQPTSDFCFQRPENLALALKTNAGHLGFQSCSIIIPEL